MNERNITITINDDDIKRHVTDSGYYLDEIAKAIGFFDSNQLFDENLQYAIEAGDSAINEYDFESAFITYLNDNAGSIAKLNIKNAKAIQVAANLSDLLNGAYMALNELDAFNEALEQFKDDESEKARDNMPTLSGVGAAFEQAYDWSNDYAYQEWLKGDRSDYGVLDTFSKAITQSAHNVNYVEGSEDVQSSLTITVDKFELADFCELDDERYAMLDDRQLAEAFKTAVIDWIEYKAQANVTKDKQEAAARRAEYDRVKAYKAEQAQAAETRRIEKLQSMTKA